MRLDTTAHRDGPTPDTPRSGHAPADAALLDRAVGACLGLAIGDALGATVEFMTAREIAARHGVHKDLTGGGWLRLRPGQVTDDTTMSLALGEALLDGAARGMPPDAPDFDARHVARHFVGWLQSRPVDCGNTCRRGIQRHLRDGSLAGPMTEGDAGNGALMRNLPAALATLWDDAAFERVSLAQARFTHHHPMSDAAVLGLGRLTRALIRGERPQAAQACIDALLRAEPRFRFDPYPGRASAFVVDTVQTVLHHWVRYPDPELALIATVNRGDDADTTGALIGMLLGARQGTAAFPGRWHQGLDPAVHAACRRQAQALLALADPDYRMNWST